GEVLVEAGGEHALAILRPRVGGERRGAEHPSRGGFGTELPDERVAVFAGSAMSDTSTSKASRPNARRAAGTDGTATTLAPSGSSAVATEQRASSWSSTSSTRTPARCSPSSIAP